MPIHARAKSDVHIKSVRGDSLEFVFNFVNENGNPVDFSGWTVKAQAIGKSSGNMTDLPATLDESSVTIRISPEAITTMDDFSNFDIQFTNADETERVTPAGGVIQLSQEVTT